MRVMKDFSIYLGNCSFRLHLIENHRRYVKWASYVYKDSKFTESILPFRSLNLYLNVNQLECSGKHKTLIMPPGVRKVFEI